jgi:hypothetical protein
MKTIDPIREQIVTLLHGGEAHARFEEAVKDFPAELQGVRPDGAPHSAWELLEHIRIAQWDIYEFSVNAKHVSPKWPEGYWPESPKPPNAAAWTKSVEAIKKDLAAMQQLVADPKTDLNQKIAHGTGHTVLREALLLADHNAYHLGQLVLVRRLLKAWQA